MRSGSQLCEHSINRMMSTADRQTDHLWLNGAVQTKSYLKESINGLVHLKIKRVNNYSRIKFDSYSDFQWISNEVSFPSCLEHIHWRHAGLKWREKWQNVTSCLIININNVYTLTSVTKIVNQWRQHLQSGHAMFIFLSIYAHTPLCRSLLNTFHLSPAPWIVPCMASQSEAASEVHTPVMLKMELPGVNRGQTSNTKGS